MYSISCLLGIVILAITCYVIYCIVKSRKLHNQFLKVKEHDEKYKHDKRYQILKCALLHAVVTKEYYITSQDRNKGITFAFVDQHGYILDVVSTVNDYVKFRFVKEGTYEIQFKYFMSNEEIDMLWALLKLKGEIE